MISSGNFCAQHFFDFLDDTRASAKGFLPLDNFEWSSLSTLSYKDILSPDIIVKDCTANILWVVTMLVAAPNHRSACGLRGALGVVDHRIAKDGTQLGIDHPRDHLCRRLCSGSYHHETSCSDWSHPLMWTSCEFWWQRQDMTQLPKMPKINPLVIHRSTATWGLKPRARMVSGDHQVASD